MSRYSASDSNPVESARPKDSFAWGENPWLYAMGSWARRTVRFAGRPIVLSVREFALLELFMRRADEVLTRSEIIEHIWDWAYDGTSNVVDWYVKG